MMRDRSRASACESGLPYSATLGQQVEIRAISRAFSPVDVDLAHHSNGAGWNGPKNILRWHKESIDVCDSFMGIIKAVSH